MLEELPVVEEGVGRAKGGNGDMQRGQALRGQGHAVPSRGAASLINPDGPEVGRGEQRPGRLRRNMGEFYYPLHGFQYFLDLLQQICIHFIIFKVNKLKNKKTNKHKLYSPLWKTAWWLLKSVNTGTFLVVQWLRLHAPNAGGMGSNPGQGTKILHDTWYNQNK